MTSSLSILFVAIMDTGAVCLITPRLKIDLGSRLEVCHINLARPQLAFVAVATLAAEQSSVV